MYFTPKAKSVLEVRNPRVPRALRASGPAAGCAVLPGGSSGVAD